MTLAEGLAIIISSLSVIATVVGWTIVYRQQKQMINVQSQIDEEREKKETRLKILLSEIEEITSWLNEGHDLVLLSSKVDANTLKQRLLEWQLKYNKVVESSDLFHYDVPIPGSSIYTGKETSQEVSSFYEYVVTVINARAEGDETKALEKLTDGQYVTYDTDIVRSQADGFDILLPEGFWNDYIGPRIYFDGLRQVFLK